MKSIKNLINKIKEMEPKKKVILGGSTLAVVALLTAGGLYIGLNSSDSKTQPNDKKVTTTTTKINKTEKSEDKKEEKVEEQKQEEEVKVEPMNEIYYAKGQQKMYSKPNNQGDVIGELSDGQAIAITGKTEDNNYQVNWQGATGYMKTDTVQAEEPQQTSNQEGNSNSGSSNGNSNSSSSHSSSSHSSSSNGGSSHSSSSNGGSSNGGSSNGGSSNGGGSSQPGSGSSGQSYSTGWNNTMANNIYNSMRRKSTNVTSSKDNTIASMTDAMYSKFESWAEQYFSGSISGDTLKSNFYATSDSYMSSYGQEVFCMPGVVGCTIMKVSTSSSNPYLEVGSAMGTVGTSMFMKVKCYNNGDGTTTVYCVVAS